VTFHWFQFRYLVCRLLVFVFRQGTGSVPRLSSAQITAQRRIADAGAAGLAPERLGQQIVRAIQIAISVDGYRLFGIDPGSHLVNRVLAASDNDGWARTEYLQTIYLAYPEMYTELSNVIAAGLPAAAFQERQSESWGYTREMLGDVSPTDHYRIFHEMNSPVGGGIQAVFRAQGEIVAAMQIYRREGRTPFRATDVAFLRIVAPTIGGAIAASLRREKALRTNRAQSAAGGPAGVLVVGGNGQVRFATPQGEHWFDALSHAEAGAEGPLPTAIWAAIARLRAARETTPVGAVTVDAPAGPIRIEATRAGRDAEDDVSIVLTPVQPPSLPEPPAHWPLTRQEREVVRLVLRGTGNQAIAGALSIGEHTVETHLSHIYDKLDVRGRGPLLSRFFRETFYAGIDDPADVDID
jgi:DNA-binding CsgD family transcriptional regulator/GAF domain-containing protein